MFSNTTLVSSSRSSTSRPLASFVSDPQTARHQEPSGRLMLHTVIGNGSSTPVYRYVLLHECGYAMPGVTAESRFPSKYRISMTSVGFMGLNMNLLQANTFGRIILQ